MYNTGNPIPSAALEDMADNAQTFDALVTKTEGTTTDRLGRTRRVFQQILMDMGFQPLSGSFQTGATITARNQTLYDEVSQVFYAWGGVIPVGGYIVPAGSTPATAGGIGALLWVDRTDLALRSALALKDGEKLVGMCEDLTALRATEPEFDGQTIKLKQHTAGTFKGGGRFRALLNGAGYTDNNGTIIKTTGGSVWLRINADIITPLMFGAIGDGATNDSSALNSCFASSLKNNVDMLGLTYSVTSTVIFNGAGKRTFKNGTISAASAITITRVYSYGHMLDNIIINGNNIDGTTGIVVDSAAIGFKYINGEIKNTGSSAIILQASNSLIKNNTFTNCGNGISATGNFRATIYANAVDSCEISSNTASICRWGFYIREDLLLAKRQGNKVLNNRIKGNNLLQEADSQGLSFQNQDSLFVVGNVVDDFGNNGIDMQFCSDTYVSGNYVIACNDGVFIGDRSCSGYQVVNNSIDGCVQGIRFYNTPDYPNMNFSGINISGNNIKNCSEYSIFISLTEPTSVNRLTNVDCNTCTLSKGIYIKGLKLGSVSNNKTYRTALEGIYIHSCEGIDVESNIINDAGYGSQATYNSIKLEGNSTRCFVRDNYCLGNTVNGVRIEAGCINNIVTGNRARSITGSALSDAGTGTITTVTNSTV